MSVKIYNNKVLVDDEDLIPDFMNFLKIQEQQLYKDRDGEFNSRTKFRRLYRINNDGSIVFPKGILDFLPDDLEYENHMNPLELPEYHISDIDKDFIRTCLQPESGFDLRTDQITAISKLLHNKWGILQMATGSGKTEVLAGILKYFYKELGYYPKTLLVEPSLHLVESTTRRFNKYNIPTSMYTEHRDITKTPVIVTHPMSLNNDLLENPELLDCVKISMFDECHHIVSNTWSTLMRNFDYVEYVVGTSASVISRSNLEEMNTYKDIRNFSYKEASAMGYSGRIILYIPPSYYIKRGILAQPVVLQLNNSANESCKNEKSWMSLYKSKINSAKRDGKLSRAVSFFVKNDRKVLILVNTKDHARDIAIKLSELGHEEDLRISFGSQIFEEVKDLEVQVTEEENIMEKFDNDEYRILIATQHLNEGFDVPDLDVAVLAGGGKSDRILIQRLGRMMRKSKTGTYGYVIDFNDFSDKILRRHSKYRETLYRDIIGLEDDYIYKSINVDEMKDIVRNLEEI